MGMRIRIVCYEDVDAWILGKFAKRLCAGLTEAGCAVDIAKTPDPEAQVNHHIIYLDRHGRSGQVDTTMVTHVDEIGKVRLLAGMMDDLDAAICMSRQAVEELAAQGLPRTRLAAIQPAHDGLITPRSLVFGIASQVHQDGRKREGMLLDVAAELRPDEAVFRIMGGGWERQVAVLLERGFTVEWTPSFEPKAYRAMMPDLDYYLYFGLDEGSMGFLDALAAGVQTIVTAQGFHLDAPGGITHPFLDAAGLRRVVAEIAAERRSRLSSIATWTWQEYARRHLALWENLLAQPAGLRQVPADGPTGPGLGLAARWRLGRRLLGGSLRSRLRRGRLW
jgi:hypothetical protein